MSRKELRARARAQLGGKIFAESWLIAILVSIIVAAVTGVSNVVPVVGAIIVSGPLAYGMSKLFLKQARDNEKMDIAGVFDGFKEDFAGNLLLGLMQAIFIALWSMLFVIPGIVKSYAYSMAYFIKNDDPSKGWKQCIDESRAMMKGHKMQLFLLDLSFIGWIIVGSFCFGIGVLWVEAYMQAARAQFYESIKPVEEAAPATETFEINPTV